jgi:hypothetical protein
MYVHSSPWTHVRKPYPYERLRKTVPAHLEIDEVTTGASLSMETSPTIPMNTRTQTLPLWALLKDCVDESRDWRSHHRRLAIDGNIVYHWNHNVVKSWNKFMKIRALVPSRGLKPGWIGSTTNLTNWARHSLSCFFFTYDKLLECRKQNLVHWRHKRYIQRIFLE